MGTIIARTRANGSIGYTAQIRLKRDGVLVHNEVRTFDKKQLASVWLKRREAELSHPGAIERANNPKGTLGEAIDQYVLESQKQIGRTKAQVLKSIKSFQIADLSCERIRSDDIVTFARELNTNRTPQTIGNYVSHLAAIFAVAKPAWGYPLDPMQMKEAQVVLRRMGMISKSKQRDRRPTLDEIDRLMEFFVRRDARGQATVPMHRVIAFALFATRRQEEIVTIKWSDLDVEHKRILVRDMKHPGQKIGNDIWCDLPDEALAVILAMPRNEDRIFPYTVDAVSAAFTRACRLEGIEDLHFHDLRHEGISRLFEMGKTIPQAASVSGHRSWSSLKRYAHLRQSGDKYADWPWMRIVAPLPAKPNVTPQ